MPIDLNGADSHLVASKAGDPLALHVGTAQDFLVVVLTNVFEEQIVASVQQHDALVPLNHSGTFEAERFIHYTNQFVLLGSKFHPVSAPLSACERFVPVSPNR